jgi:hypothetical protein
LQEGSSDQPKRNVELFLKFRSGMNSVENAECLGDCLPGVHPQGKAMSQHFYTSYAIYENMCDGNVL